jgi:RHS repeat-associated protein
MKHILTFFLLLSEVACLGQTDSKNYILSRTFKQTGAFPNDISKVNIQVQYIDGLGRPLQNVSVGQSPGGADVVQPIEYDVFGRQVKQYLPYIALSNGAFQAGIPAAQAGFYSANSAGLEPTDLARPYSETGFELSALNRPATEMAPGNKSALATISYGANTAGEVKRYDYVANANILLTVGSNGDYGAGKLYRTQTIDESGKVNTEYTDMQGRLICQKIAASDNEILATYYVYDDYGQLRAVLQPQYQDNASTSDYAFLYEYDNRGRVIAKKIPGAGLVNLVYDNFDRQVLTQDASQLSRAVWGFTKYDALNRAVLTGEIASASSRTTWQNSLNASQAHHEDKTASGIGYTLANTLPNIAEANLLAVTYYDDYTFPKPANLGYVNTYAVNALSTAKNLQTGARVRMLAGANVWLASATYYDAEYRAIQTVRELHDLGPGAIERVSMQYKYDLASVIAQEKAEQIIATGTNVHLKTYEYDHADRLLSVKEKVVNGSKSREAVTIAQRYNALGQLQHKWFHSEDGINFRRRTTYTNNIRGWLAQGQTFYKTKENEPDSSFYNFALSYANGNSYTNGNISQMQWSGKAENTFTKGMAFTYDGANRLLGSTGLNNYAETEGGISYDKNGNIKTLIRSGVVLDNLSYAYVGNRLSAVTDASGSNLGVKNGVSTYAYDGNGNMTSDGNRGAVLNYNYLNLPKTVTIAGKTLTYDYDAAGTKHKYVADTLTAKYAGDFEYNQINVFKRLSISEGQAVYRKDSIRFDYYLKDHLGNVRVVFDERGRILQKTDYYPFGLEIDRNAPVQTPSARNNVNRLLYNGKELQVGTGYMDYGARMYMPEVGRWGVVDPLTEISAGFSPFMYGNDNPILMIDPNGMRTTYNWGTGQYEDDHGGNVGFEQAKHEYGVGGTSDGNINCCPNSPNILAAEAKKDNSVKGRLASAGWKSGQPMPAIDGIETDLSIESVVIPLVKPVEWMARPLVGLIRAQWLASRVAKNLLNPKEIHFMQNSIKNVTGEFTVLGNAEALRAGTLDPRLLTMSVWKDASGKVWTLDHRRLAAFRISGLKEAPVQWANPSGQMWKLTTTNAGTSIKLKLGQGQSITVK